MLTQEASVGTVDGIAYLTAAARVADVLSGYVLLALIESSVISPAYQIRALSSGLH